MKTLACGSKVKQRPFNYVEDWLNEESNGKPKKYLRKKFRRSKLNELNSLHFWYLFHKAANDELNGKF